MYRARLIAVFLGAWTVAVWSAAPTAFESLTRFFEQAQSYTARFEQVMVDETNREITRSSGRVWIERPGKFRWSYNAPYKQEIVTDGKTLWVYDEALKQVTVRAMNATLAEGPAMLLAGRGRIEDQFTIVDVGDGGRFQWAELTPKKKDTGIERIRVGFEQGRLRKIETIDGFGQTTRYAFTDAMENIKIASARFEFTPPTGVDVVGAP